LLLASQIADATTSARVLSSGRELNVTLQPFSHGGVTTMLAGEIFIDAAQERAARRWSAGQRNNVTVLFIVEHTLCALHNAKQMQSAPLQAAVPVANF
jgi:hypothetical protein